MWRAIREFGMSTFIWLVYLGSLIIPIWLIGYGMGFKAASREADRMTALLAAKARGERSNVRN
jgi:hypothetical protein